MSQEEKKECQSDGGEITTTATTTNVEASKKPAEKLHYFFLSQGLPALSLVIILTSVVLKYLTDSFKSTLGLSCSSTATTGASPSSPSSSSASWGSLILVSSSFLVYSLGLIWISVHVSSRFGSYVAGKSAAGTASAQNSPTTLARLRSHLTFLPIIHFIRHRPSPPLLPQPCEILRADTTASQGSNGSDNGGESVDGGDDRGFVSKLEFQRDALIDAILDSYVFPWYGRISDEKTFPVQSKRILQTSFDRLAKKFRQMDRTAAAREAIEVIHYHWKNYLDAAGKQTSGADAGLEQHFRYLHSFLDSREQVTQHCESLVAVLLREILIPDLQSHFVCRFLAGIIVKGFILYYFDLVSNPKWINYSAVSLLSSGTLNVAPPAPELPVSTNDSSRESLCDLSSTCKCGCMESSQSSSHRESDSSLPTDTTQPHSHRPSADNSDKDSDNKVENPSPVPTNQESSGESKTDEANILSKTQTASVSAALGGLLSTTALPLLPEGYNLQAISSPLQPAAELAVLQQKDTVRTEDTSNSTAEEADKKVFDVVDLENEMACEPRERADTNKSASNSGTTATTPVYSMNRHLSLEEGPKPKTPLIEDTGTRSLDESKTNCTVLRQDEFDLGGENSLKPGVGLPAKSDISPTYDEAEDFAATIAKLRSLLEQRESKKNLHDNVQENQQQQEQNNEANGDAEVFNANGSNAGETKDAEDQQQQQSNQGQPNTNATATPPQPIRRITESVRPSLNSQSSASSLGSDGSLGSNNSQSSLDAERLEKIVDELEEGGPQVNRFFINVGIPKTETCSDSSGQFVLYSIQYEGVYLEENDDGQLEKLVLRTTTIKRRFQEFLTLHNQLEENPLWRSHIKGIKAPSKWLNLSFAKSESANIAQRKGMLERYLQQLCYHPVLGFCPYIRQFMAYGEEGFYAFVGSDAIPLHRFDKIARKFTGVFNTFRDALPSFETELLAVPSSPDMASKSPTESRGKSLFASFLRAEKHSPLEKIESAKQGFQGETKSVEGNGNDDSNPDSNGNNKADQDNNGEGKEAIFNAEPLADTSNSTTFTDGEALAAGSMDAVYPLAAAATELLCDVLWLPHHRPHSTSVSAFLSISGKSFENYIQDFLDVFFSQEAILGYLEAATMAIREWAQADEGAVLEPEIPNTSELELKNCLRQKIPVWVRWMWGRSRVDVTIDRLTKVCQDMQINQDLMLSLMELLFSRLVDLNLLENEQTEKVV